jgi:uncharacterized membrane-anchored protein
MFERMLGVALLCWAIGPGAAWGQSDAIRSEFAAALRDAQSSQVLGPSEVKLLDEAVLMLPEDYTFVPVPAAGRLLKALGNAPDPHLVGVIFPGHQDNWMMAIQFEKSGFIRDDDARDWNVDDLLKSVSESTEHGNSERRQLGFPEIQVLGWAEKPRYDPAAHRLVWAVVARDKKNAVAASEQGVNYNTYALGRDGYFKLNLVTDLKDLAAQKSAADTVFESLQYLEGKKYADFNPATDKSADFSLVALVAGLAAKKLGLLAVLGNAAIEYLKFIIIAGIVMLFLLGWLIFRKVGTKSDDDELSRDDFPPTIVSTVALDEPTIPQPRGATRSFATATSVALPPAPSPASSSLPRAEPLPLSDQFIPKTTTNPLPTPAANPPAALPAAAVAPAQFGTPVQPMAHTPLVQAVAASPAPPPLQAPVSTPAPVAAPAAAIVVPSSLPAALSEAVAATPIAAPAVDPALPSASTQSELRPQPSPPPPASAAAASQSHPSGPSRLDAHDAPAPAPLIGDLSLDQPVPLVPETPLFQAPVETDVPDVSEPEMVFTPRQTGQAALLIPALVSEPMLLFSPSPPNRPQAPVTPAPSDPPEAPKSAPTDESPVAEADKAPVELPKARD